MKIIFIDVETTGFSTATQEITQMAGLVTENRKILESFNLLCAPVNLWSVSKEALKVTGKTIEDLKAYPPAIDGFNKFKDILVRHVVKGQSRYIFAGQNCGFDKRFISAFWQKYKAPEDEDVEYYFNSKITYDLMEMTKPMKKAGLIDVPNVKLGTIMEAFDVKPQGNLHDALTDIIGTFDAYNKVSDKWLDLSRTNPTFTESNSTDSINHLLKNSYMRK